MRSLGDKGMNMRILTPDLYDTIWAELKLREERPTLNVAKFDYPASDSDRLY